MRTAKRLQEAKRAPLAAGGKDICLSGPIMSARIAIITEGSVTLGLGHVQRMLVLAKTLRRRVGIVFVTQSGLEVRDKISAEGFRVVEAAQDYRRTLIELSPLDQVIIDRLEVKEELAAWLKQILGVRVAIFGNVSAANQYADLVVNAIIGTQFKNRRRRVSENETLYLEGPRYVLLGESFRKMHGTYRYRGALNRILLMFGGSDQANLTCRVIGLLRKARVLADITACVGAVYPHDDALERLVAAETREGRVLRVVRNSDAVAELMLDADFLVTSPGNSLFEAFTLGVPAIAFFQTSAQAEMFRGFPYCFEQGMIEDIALLLKTHYRDYHLSKARVSPLAAGEGYEEIVNALMSSLRRPSCQSFENKT